MCFILSLIDKNVTCAIWVFNAGLWYYWGKYKISQYERLIDCQDDMLEHYIKIMSVQSDIIKKLEDKLNGENHKDNADSGAGVVAEEALQAHEE